MSLRGVLKSTEKLLKNNADEATIIAMAKKKGFSEEKAKKLVSDLEKTGHIEILTKEQKEAVEQIKNIIRNELDAAAAGKVKAILDGVTTGDKAKMDKKIDSEIVSKIINIKLGDWKSLAKELEKAEDLDNLLDVFKELVPATDKAAIKTDMIDSINGDVTNWSDISKFPTNLKTVENAITTLVALGEDTSDLYAAINAELTNRAGSIDKSTSKDVVILLQKFAGKFGTNANLVVKELQDKGKAAVQNKNAGDAKIFIGLADAIGEDITSDINTELTTVVTAYVTTHKTDIKTVDMAQFTALKEMFEELNPTGDWLTEVAELRTAMHTFLNDAGTTQDDLDTGCNGGSCQGLAQELNLDADYTAKMTSFSGGHGGGSGSAESTDPGSAESTDPGSAESTDPGSAESTDPGSAASTDPCKPDGTTEVPDWFKHKTHEHCCVVKKSKKDIDICKDANFGIQYPDDDTLLDGKSNPPQCEIGQEVKGTRDVVEETTLCFGHSFEGATEIDPIFVKVDASGNLSYCAFETDGTPISCDPADPDVVPFVGDLHYTF